MRNTHFVLFFLGVAAVSMSESGALATTYAVNRSFTDGFATATLSGTVDIPQGNHLIQNASASPFTNVNLILAVNAASYNLTNSLTDIIQGTAQFLINANPVNLVFQPILADGFNPADLVFSDTTVSSSNNRYVIGSNGSPGFEAAYTNAGSVIRDDASFPTAFGVVIPEPGGLMMLGLGLIALLIRRSRAN